ncbi:MAG TPA: hypothetical protein VGD56_04895, partial [Gemmatirosa sp.]
AGGNLPLNTARGDEVIVFALDGAGQAAVRTGATSGAIPGATGGAAARAAGDSARGAGGPAVDPVTGRAP